ncbi:hypothetical protein GCM10010967_46110 [Dyadobacter beijingensis]|uniref:Uncharacterized protein n=1 Tax=Dyadobacter beijingensis TaxID=365489 RepID=A0ABQ2IB12_9BACT|nr:hypothetical protein GCM10010967_46110 [Dyadobacter beijingensis]
MTILSSGISISATFSPIGNKKHVKVLDGPGSVLDIFNIRSHERCYGTNRESPANSQALSVTK